MFWSGLFLGACVGMIALSLCKTSARADLEMEIMILRKEIEILERDLK